MSTRAKHVNVTSQDSHSESFQEGISETYNSALLDYFDELLIETDSDGSLAGLTGEKTAIDFDGINSSPSAPPMTVPPPSTSANFSMPKREQAATSPLLRSHAALAGLEEAKRRQLQELLSRQLDIADTDSVLRVRSSEKQQPVIETPVSIPEVQVAAPVEKTTTHQVQASVVEPLLTSAEDMSQVAAHTSTQVATEKAQSPSIEKDLDRDQSIADGTATEERANSTGSIDAFLEWADNGRPHWAQNQFDVLLFKVSGLTLAVPLIALGHIQSIGEQLTPIFGQSKWFMGLLNSPHGQIRTINTALFVMPERYSDTFQNTAKYVISIDGLPWGLAVDSVDQPVSINPSDVKWRTQRTSRPWLAGTVKTAMCALIDIPRMGAILEQQ